MCLDSRSSTRKTSHLVYGPISRQRWIYACSKQPPLDRVIYAYGVRDGVDYIASSARSTGSGLKLDDVAGAEGGKLAPLHAVHIERDL